MTFKTQILKIRPVLATILLSWGALWGGLGWATATDQNDIHWLVESLIESRGQTEQGKLQNPEVLAQKLTDLKAQLKAHQSEELKNYFKEVFNLDLGFENPFEFARLKSRENLNRLRSNKKNLEQTLEFQKSFAAMKRMTSRFRHNTTTPPTSPLTPPLWLSSKKLDELGFKDGLQGMFWFNREFLKTKNWVFFFTNAESDAFYGRGAIFVKKDYADQVGLIFPFVMYLSDLGKAGFQMNPGLKVHRVFPEEFGKLRPKFLRFARSEGTPLADYAKAQMLIDKKASKSLQFLDDHLEVFQNFRTHLIDFMFTPEDYRTLVSEKLALQLLHLKRKKDLQGYHSMLESLDSGDLSKISTYVREALKKAKLPSHYELRIPVAIPGSQLEVELPPPRCEEALSNNDLNFSFE
ncbi:MAG TPA: hypothetical protein DCL41_07985 [Bdellovibrionales bacterium]|nr:hypothetical protein [Bdellovibrionales bacterium]|tara:strand:- start:2810 stop:4033 length:1224 start_codon:yes stop_codon:yes gene_type:complete